MHRYRIEDDVSAGSLDQLAATLERMEKAGWILVSAFTYHADRGFEHTRYIFRKAEPE